MADLERPSRLPDEAIGESLTRLDDLLAPSPAPRDSAGSFGENIPY